MRQSHLVPKFTEEFPSPLEPGVLYISMEYASSAHLCCCGCSNEVNTMFSPRDWRMTFDGETVSLHPSIGNWSLPCKSHYIIDKGNVRWSGAWTKEQIEANRQRDRDVKARHYGTPAEPVTPSVPEPLAPPPVSQPKQPLWRMLVRIIGLGK